VPLYVPPRSEVVLAFPEPIKPLGKVRSTFVIGSIDTMKGAGQYEAYVAHLAAEHRDALLGAVPATWLPVDVATAHYRACNALGLAPSEAARRGGAALERLGGLVYGTALQMAKQAGATPWTVLPALQRFWSRAYDGGGIAVYKVGPKDARVDLVSCGLCQVPYYRHALAGLLQGLIALFCGTLYFQEAPRQPAGPDSVSYRAQWA
jgi:hypothetical protein